MPYDVLIIGAGPSGLFCAYELLRRGVGRVAVVDAGRPYAQKACPLLTRRRCAGCGACATLTGEGGAAFFHAGKLSFYPAGSGLKELLKSEARCEAVYARVRRVFEDYGIPLNSRDQPAGDRFAALEEDGLEIKYYCSVPVEQAAFVRFMERFGAFIRERAALFFETAVVSVERDGLWRVTGRRRDGAVALAAKRLVVATGEYGFRWWKRLAERLGVEKEAQSVDIGIRVECDPEIMEPLWPYHKDMKARVSAPDGSELRTYCVLKNGQTVYCNYGDYTVLDGILDNHSRTAGITIFNRLRREHLQGEDPIGYAAAFLERFYTKHSEPLRTSLASFLKRAAAPSERIGCTLDNLPVQAYDEELPAFIQRNLAYGLERFDRLIPGLLDGDNWVLMPVMDSLWDAVRLSAGMETSVPGLYVTGDATGRMRGILQSCVTGLLCADGIINAERGAVP